MYLCKPPTYTSIKVLYTVITISMCQAAIFYIRSWLQGIFLLMETGAGNRFQVPSLADGLAHVPGFTKLLIAFWDWCECATATNHSSADGLQVWTGPAVRVGWITEKCSTHILHVYEFNRVTPHTSHKHKGSYFCKAQFPASRWIQFTKQHAICVRLINIHTITGNKCKKLNE